MADGYARVSGRVGVCSVHQGPGLTNTMTGLTEAAKSRTPVLVLAGETPAAALTSNFRIDQHDLVESVGAIADRVHSPKTAADDAQRAYQRALIERRPVVLMLPIDIQPQHAASPHPTQRPLPPFSPPAPNQHAISAAADLLARAERPAIIAGRGAVLAGARDQLEALGEQTGAILATSAPANGLFAGLPYNLGISGGFASPFATELLPQADVVVVVGASINHWTTKHGALIAPDAPVVQIDDDARAIGRNHSVDIAILGDALTGAQALTEALARRNHKNTGFRTPELAEQIASPPLAPRALRGRRHRRVDRPAHADDRAERPAPAGTERRGRLGPLHRLPVDVPRRPGPARVGVRERLPGGRARPRQRDRRLDRAPRRPDRGGARRRRHVPGAARARDRGAAEADAARR